MAILDDLPSEILHQITGYIEYKIDLFALAQTDHRFNLIADERLYKNLGQQNWTPDASFSWAVENGKETCLRRFLQAGILIPSDTPHKPHPIFIAAVKGYTGIGRLLLEYGVDPNLSRWVGLSALQNPLTVATSEGHESVVKALIEHGADLELAIELVNRHQNKEITQPLSIAVKKGHKSLVKLFLDHGCNPLTPNYDEDGSIMDCAWVDAAGSDLDILRMFIDKGFEFELTSPAFSYLSNSTHLEVLRDALRNGDMPLSKFLFAHAADLEPGAPPREYDYRKALLLALKDGHMSVVKFLLSLDAEFQVRPRPCNDTYDPVEDEDLLYAIGFAAGKYQLDTEFLLRVARVNKSVQQKNWRSIVCLTVGATKGGDENFMKRLLNIELPETLRAEKWRDHLGACLSLAAWHGHYELAKVLLDYGANPNGATKCHHGFGSHKPPIFAAAENGFADIFSLLLDRGADTFNDKRWSLLQDLFRNEQVSEARTEMLRLLVAEGQTYRSGFLAGAVEGGPTAFHIVLEHIGCKLQPGNFEHEIAFEESVSMGETTIMEIFLKAGFNPNSNNISASPSDESPKSFLRLAAQKTDPPGIGERAVDLLLKYGADLNWRDPRRNEPPHYCLDKPEAVRLLVKKGADPLCVCNPNGDSMLLDATRFGVSPTVKVLLQAFDEQDIPFEKAGPIVEEAIRDKKRSGRNPKAGEHLRRWYYRRVYACQGQPYVLY